MFRKQVRISLSSIYHKISVFFKSAPLVIPYKPKGHYRAVHFSAFSYGNAGDTLLTIALRDLFNNSLGVRKWMKRHVHQLVTPKDVIILNKQDFIVVGGGGLFLADTNPNDNSGWQWNCSIDNLKIISSPIIAFAIGYNRFRNQDDFKPVFKKHLNQFVKQAVFVGIRNNGSIDKLRKYLDNENLKEKLVFQPCMTTLISKIYPNFCCYKEKDNVVAFNCAFDRSSLRGITDEKIYSISKVAKKLSERYAIKYYSHTRSDQKALKYFNACGVNYELVELATNKQIIQAYSSPKLVIGMRGHAQMIPFGCSTPILSIISHDKMRWFLEDIHHVEWGVELTDANFEEILLKKANYLLDNYRDCISDIEAEKARLWDITNHNLKVIKECL